MEKTKQYGSKAAAQFSEDRGPEEMDGVPSHEAISLLAYEKFCRRGYVDGLAEQNWPDAKQELNEQHRQTVARA